MKGTLVALILIALGSYPASSVLAAGMPVIANTTGAQPADAMGLKEAVQAALKDNPQLKSGVWTVRSARQDVGIAKSNYLPALKFEDRYMRTNNPTLVFMNKLNESRFTSSDFAIDSLNSPEAVNDFQGSVSLQQVIFSKRLNDSVGISKAVLAAKKESLEGLRQKVALETADAYLGAVTASRFRDAARQGVADAREHKRIASLRYQSGLGLYSDVLRADSALKEAQKRQAEAQKEYDVARMGLGLAMGRSQMVQPLYNSTSPEMVSAPGQIDAYYNSIDNRPDVKAMEAQTEAAGKAVGLAKSAYWPDLGAGGQYQWNDHRSPFEGEGSSYTVQGFLRWTIFDGTKTRHEIKKAEAGYNQAGSMLDGLKKKARFDIFQAYSELNEAEKNLALSRAELESATEGNRLVQTRYKNSLAPIVDVLDSQTSLDAARAGVIEAENGYLQKYFRLEYESGKIIDFIDTLKETVFSGGANETK